MYRQTSVQTETIRSLNHLCFSRFSRSPSARDRRRHHHRGAGERRRSRSPTKARFTARIQHAPETVASHDEAMEVDAPQDVGEGPEETEKVEIVKGPETQKVNVKEASSRNEPHVNQTEVKKRTKVARDKKYQQMKSSGQVIPQDLDKLRNSKHKEVACAFHGLRSQIYKEDYSSPFVIELQKGQMHCKDLKVNLKMNQSTWFGLCGRFIDGNGRLANNYIAGLKGGTNSKSFNVLVELDDTLQEVVKVHPYGESKVDSPLSDTIWRKKGKTLFGPDDSQNRRANTIHLLVRTRRFKPEDCFYTTYVVVPGRGPKDYQNQALIFLGPGFGHLSQEDLEQLFLVHHQKQEMCCPGAHGDLLKKKYKRQMNDVTL
jgi:hypothetical protein